jgi:hypothetical protein
MCFWRNGGRSRCALNSVRSQPLSRDLGQVQTWCRILAQVPRSRLILKGKPFLCAETQQFWLRRFTARGISGWRVTLLPLTADTSGHLRQYSMMDISLDPWPYAGAHASSFHTPSCSSFVRLCHRVIYDIRVHVYVYDSMWTYMSIVLAKQNGKSYMRRI